MEVLEKAGTQAPEMSKRSTRKTEQAGWVVCNIDNDKIHSEKSKHLSMEAWPYRQECRGHDPVKKKTVALMPLALLASCALKHFRDSV